MPQSEHGQPAPPTTSIGAGSRTDHKAAADAPKPNNNVDSEKPENSADAVSGNVQGDPEKGDRGRPISKWSLGVLNDPRTHQVPGSVLLLTGHRNEPLGLRNAPALTSHSSLPPQAPVHERPSMGSRQASRHSVHSVKKTKDGAIVLEPQPEDSQNDPLNWPAWRRDAALLSLGFYCMLGGGMTPILAAGFNDVSATFGVTTEKVALTTGLYMMGLGLGSVVFSPTAILWGKRPVYLLAAIMFSSSAVWCALARSFPSLLVGRIFQGIAVSPVECLPSATIAEIFFLHERAYRLGIYTLLLLGGKNLTPLSSKVNLGSHGDSSDLALNPEEQAEGDADVRPSRPPLSHRNTQNLHVGFAVPDVNNGNQEPSSEAIDRTPTSSVPQIYVDGVALADVGLSPASECGSHSVSTALGVETADDSDAASSLGPLPLGPKPYTHTLRSKPAQTFTQQLRPWNGRLHYDNWFRVALRPFVLFAYPAVLWSSIVYACSVGWLIVLSESVSVIYRAADTYNFSALSAGLIYVSPFVGGVLGTAVAGKVSDVVVLAMTRRNGGLYEPEFRLVMAAPVALTTIAGLVGYGWSVQAGDHWIVPTVFFGVISFGCSLGSTTSITFCVDSYRQYAGEALVTLNVTKNILHGLVFSLFFNSWLQSKGPKSVFVWLGVIQLVLLTGTVPLYVYGKRARMWTTRQNLMEKF
ncbi:hypothetical protein SEPCBS119000_003627 [Sporothrix epigloea]|uniref:Major facilitator superfamily transporter n=1 Tax=Sporothrix epigloea TaxID=1892477 RepID=A0ABP0DMS9_9PEZI